MPDVKFFKIFWQAVFEKHAFLQTRLYSYPLPRGLELIKNILQAHVYPILATGNPLERVWSSRVLVFTDLINLINNTNFENKYIRVCYQKYYIFQLYFLNFILRTF